MELGSPGVLETCLWGRDRKGLACFATKEMAEGGQTDPGLKAGEEHLQAA